MDAKSVKARRDQGRLIVSKMNIDLHNHVIPPAVVDALTRDPARYGTGIEEQDGKRYFNVHGRYAELQPAFYDIDAKVEWMDRSGIDIAGISVGPPIYFYCLQSGDRPRSREARQRRHRADGREASGALARDGAPADAGPGCRDR